MYERENRKKEKWPDKKWMRIICTGSGIIYTACLIYIFFFARRRWRTFPIRNFNLVPFRDKINYLQIYGTHINPVNLEFYKDLFGNILLFIPFPLLIHYFFKIKSYPRLLLMAACTSLSVEIIQYVFNIGVADIDDLLLNTLGAFIGLSLLYARISLKKNKSQAKNTGAGPEKLRYNTPPAHF